MSTQWTPVDGSDFKNIHVAVRGYNDLLLCELGQWTDACKPDIELKVPSIGKQWRCDYQNDEKCSWRNVSGISCLFHFVFKVFLETFFTGVPSRRIRIALEFLVSTVVYSTPATPVRADTEEQSHKSFEIPR